MSLKSGSLAPASVASPEPMATLARAGALAGLAGGAASAVVLAVLGEGPIGRAIAVEGATGDAEFGRGAQQLGGMLALLIVGVVAGVVFAVVYGLVRRPRTTPAWQWALQLAGIAFVTVFLAPFLRYPSNPPGVGDPDTIGRRTTFYLLALAWSMLATWATARGWRAMRGRGVPAQSAVPLTTLLYLALLTVGLTILPPNTDPVPGAATLIWQFRIATVAGSAAMWAVLGVVFGRLVERTGPG